MRIPTLEVIKFMKFLTNIAGISSLALLMVGCSSTPEVIEAQPFNSNYSYAYNIANQTYLTKNGSPLRDFGKDELKGIKQHSGGNTSVLFGALSIVTGNLTGVIDIAGGSVAKLADSKHKAAFSGWIVAIPSNQALNGMVAKNIVKANVQKATVDTLRKKGNRLSKITFANGEHGYAIDGLYFFGMRDYAVFENARPMLKGKTNLINAESQFVRGDMTAINGVEVFNFNSFIDGKIKGYEGYEGYEQFILDVTQELPEGYYYYQTSFPKMLKMTVAKESDWSCEKCINKETMILQASVIPAIYTQGTKYEFIKPE